MLLTAADSTCNHFKANHLENNPPSRKLMISSKCKPFSDIHGKKRIVKVLEKQLYSMDANHRIKPDWRQRLASTQLSSILDQTGQNSAKMAWKCSLLLKMLDISQQAGMGLASEMWASIAKSIKLSLDPLSNARVNLDIHHTSFFHYLKLSESSWNARVFSAYKASYILPEVTMFLKNSTDNMCAQDITKICNGSFPLLDPLTVNS